MARKVCTTQPGLSTCCQAAQAGMLNQPLQIPTRRGTTICGRCSIVQSQSKNPAKRGKPVFHFTFLPANTRMANGQPCGTSAASCAATYAGAMGAMPVPQAGMMQRMLTFPFMQ